MLGRVGTDLVPACPYLSYSEYEKILDFMCPKLLIALYITSVTTHCRCLAGFPEGLSIDPVGSVTTLCKFASAV